MQHILQQLPYYPWLVLTVAALGTFMATLDSGIVNVILPVIAASLGTELPTVQWVVLAYLLTISSLLPLFGRLGDIRGRRMVYSLGFMIFTAGSVLCGLANGIWLLVGSRVVQAVGAAMMMANAPAIITQIFPETKRGRALGIIGTVVALGSMVGPGVGGLLVGAFGWPSVFYINLPVGILGFSLARIILPQAEYHSGERLDLPGAILFAAGMTTMLIVLSKGQEWGWSSPVILAGGLVAFVLFGLFWRQESRTKQPMLDLSLFSNWTFLAGNASGLLAFMAMFFNVILLPFYLHFVLALSPNQIGVLITPFPIVMALVAPISGYLSEKTSPVLLTSSGLLIMTGGLLYFASLNSQATAGHIILGQSVMGLGNGMFQSPNNNNVLSSVTPAKLGLASGINALMRNIGMVTGTALAVSIFESRRQYFMQMHSGLGGVQAIQAFMTAYQTALITGACIAALGAIISLNRKGFILAIPKR